MAIIDKEEIQVQYVGSKRRIAKDILAEEVEHESWFLELLYGRPSAHMRRKYSGERPHTRKHSRALDLG